MPAFNNKDNNGSENLSGLPTQSQKPRADIDAIASSDTNLKEGLKKQEAEVKPKAKTIFDALKTIKDPGAKVLADKMRLHSIKQSYQRVANGIESTLYDNENTENKGSAKARTNHLSVRTFKTDLQDIVRQNKLSITKIAALESDRIRKSPKLNTKSNDKVYIFLSLMFFFLAVFVIAFALFFFFFKSQFEDNNIAEAPNESYYPEFMTNKIIFAEKKIRIDVSNKNAAYIINVLLAAKNSKNTNSKNGDIVEMELVENIGNDKFKRADIKSIISKLFRYAPPTFIDTLDKDYMFGVHNISSKKAGFIILSTNSYHFALAGMLDWEKTIEQELGPFLIDGRQYSEFLNPADRSGDFKDVVVQNYDARVLQDKYGKILILYGFVGKDRVIITNNIKTFLELAKRIQISKSL